MSVKANYFSDKDAFRESRMAGSWMIDECDEDGRHDFWYCCPCGCGSIGPLTVGDGFKPDKEPGEHTWFWNGSFDRPTLTPSVNHVGHWHGYLTDGEWKIA